MGAWTSSQHHGLLERPFEPGAEIGGDRNRSRGGVIVSHLDALRFRDVFAISYLIVKLELPIASIFSRTIRRSAGIAGLR
jgi:hypothetical protein